ncbi:MAG: hypothetical protein ACYCZ6_16250 [Polaromonas sp.]
MNRPYAINPLAALPHRAARVTRGVACALAVLGASAALAQMAAPLPAIESKAEALPALPALGTLILSPTQRRSLEALRNAVGSEAGGAPALPADRLSDVVSSLPDTLVISGVVIRSGNRSTVWVNGEALYGRITANPLRTLARRAGVFQRGTQDMQLKAKPGQVIDVPSGQAVDLLPLDAVRIIPPQAGSAGANRADPKEYPK